MGVQAKMEDSQSLTVIELDIQELENSVAHLIRSNHELKVAFEETQDPDFSEAIEENIIVIERRQKQIEELKKKLAEMSPHLQDAEMKQPEEEGEDEDGGLTL
eukprot:TRINITY_DN4392_c0_g2_i1.p1 TRINITY_DN4392_c0_g2~~TRINITY_DN4392_c0_g2_i1.p1  ORF type:complete len:113 (+),score=41.59 TRINITY_DN4392_c0_g2_i1:33-341(+)